MKRGYTLVNHLLGIFIIMVILHISSSIMRLMININTPTIGQHEVFELQLTQLLYRTNDIVCVDDILNIGEFEIVYNRNRIVKIPGYEILLQDVMSYHLTCDATITLEYQYEGVQHELTIKLP